VTTALVDHAGRLGSATEFVATTHQRYDRIAPIYDAVESVVELGADRWRSRLWRQVAPGSTADDNIDRPPSREPRS